MEIITLLQSVSHLNSRKIGRQLIVIVEGMLAMTGRVTMRGISRWTGEGGSYRTIQRFFGSTILWTHMNFALFLSGRYSKGDEIALAGDHTVVTKSGKQTHGIDYFFSSISKKAVKGLEFFSLSLINHGRRESSPLLLKQTIREKKKKTKKKQSSPEQKKPKRKRGRPKGSKNKNHRDVQLPTHLEQIKGYVESVMQMIGNRLSVKYLLLDGAFGNNNALQMARRCHLHLISKLRSDSGLYYPYQGKQKKKGAKRKYGDKVIFRKIDDAYLVKTIKDQHIETRIYRLHAWHKKFPDLLNVAVLVRIDHQRGTVGHVVLFSSDLELDTERLVDWYSLRFQIEFNFRDAKQFWGLEDFMNVRETQVTNAANLSLFMVNCSHALAADLSDKGQPMSILDLKALYRGRKYAWEVLKCLPKPPERFLINQIFANLGALGAINPS